MKQQLSEKLKGREKDWQEVVRESEGLTEYEKEMMIKGLKDSYEARVVLLVGMNTVADTKSIKE